MKIINYLTILTLSSTLVLATGTNKEELNSIIKVGESSAKILAKTLGQNMKREMKSGGVLKALDFCSNEAYSITESVNQKLPHGITVKRISTRYRNPLNKPTKEELEILNSFEDTKESPKYSLQKIETNLYKYYKPLVIKKAVCLKCHGDNINSNLQKEIDVRYPDDRATGYKMNDLRGAIVVEIDRRAN
ncbi:DUF3365 domain-containing protein [Sulfurimonas sp. SAG-AH-194-L11]|nr:DUF3365 domain-containing protein [Sulfurimonas sp. SAG-AH-194-L11]MDF1877191.1 DUF3365 domain-containing protein [Sulfurimonas sp. SAG-AH-194-L11]